MIKKHFIKFLFLIPVLATAYILFTSENDDPVKLPIGMNLDSINYYSNSLAFIDAMKSSGGMFTFNAQGESPWNTEKMKKIPVDQQGYPLELPVAVDNGPPQGVRFLINNNYKGTYKFLYDGEGEIEFRVPHGEGKQILVYLDGTGENRWIEIRKSKKGNHIRNIRILPENVDYDPKAPFNPLYLEGLKPFHCIRLASFLGIDSDQVSWEDIPKPDYYTQGAKGVAIEYGILLCNTLECDAWFCIPHKADDNFIRRYAEFVRDRLNPNLKVYIEYSNELWNWIFPQAHYVIENAPNAKDQYVSEALRSISPKTDMHPEKDAYMMQRVFKIWREVFGEKNRHRLVRVAAVQQAWTDNTRRILQYLFKTDENGKPVTGNIYKDSLGYGCDAVSPTAYFYFDDAAKKKWESMDPSKMTPKVVFEGIDAHFNEETRWTLETAKWARAWKVDYVVYEGGQHLVPFQSKDSASTKAIWDAQIDPQMYEEYMKLFKTMTLPEVDCKLFNAFAYVSRRKEMFGSWGHLESLDQLKKPNELRNVAPKYSALLDSNTPKE